MAAQKNKSSLPTKSFAGIPRIVMESESYKKLSGNAVKLLLALAYQYRGNNNGDLTTAFSIMHEKFGFTARSVVKKAEMQLLDRNLIIQTRTPMFMNPGGQCGLYALTWQPIDECQGKGLEIKPTTTAIRKFAMEKNKKPGSDSLHGGVAIRYPLAANTA